VAIAVSEAIRLGKKAENHWLRECTVSLEQEAAHEHTLGPFKPQVNGSDDPGCDVCRWRVRL